MTTYLAPIAQGNCPLSVSESANSTYLDLEESATREPSVVLSCPRALPPTQFSKLLNLTTQHPNTLPRFQPWVPVTAAPFSPSHSAGAAYYFFLLPAARSQRSAPYPSIGSNLTAAKIHISQSTIHNSFWHRTAHAARSASLNLCSTLPANCRHVTPIKHPAYLPFVFLVTHLQPDP